MPKLLFIVGLQKSGSTLLARLLERHSAVGGKIPGEGDDFWGNTPPFAPAGRPAGTVYQRSGGAAGHEIGRDDATTDVRALLERRLESLELAGPIVLNKSPYNTVRVPWLRALFPEGVVVGTLRAPLPNVFSLTKKFVPHDGRGLPPQDGWWGVRPNGWQSLLDPDPVSQCARQWTAVNGKLWTDRDLIDCFVRYEDLCAEPRAVCQGILELAGCYTSSAATPSSLRCLDGEYLTGSRLRSKNRDYHERGDLTLPEREDNEHPPLTPHQQEIARSTCENIAQRWWAPP